MTNDFGLTASRHALAQESAAGFQKMGYRENKMTPVERRVLENPKYQELIAKRTPYGWIMTIIMLLVYYGYIFLVAFNKSFMSTPIVDGWVTTWGMPLGVGVIAITVILTGIYVRRANAEFDPLTAEIVAEVER